MKLESVDIREAQVRLTELVAVVAAGSEVVLTDGARPVARLVAVPATHERTPGLHPGAISASEDFDEPLPDEAWPIGE